MMPVPGSTEERVRGILCSLLVLKPDDVKPESLLMDDLDADSITFLEMYFTLEKEFDVELPDVKADEAMLNLHVPEGVRRLEGQAGGTTFLEYLKEDAVQRAVGAGPAGRLDGASRERLFRELTAGALATALGGRVPDQIDPATPLANLRLTALFRFLTVGTLARYMDFMLARRAAGA